MSGIVFSRMLAGHKQKKNKATNQGGQLSITLLGLANHLSVILRNRMSVPSDFAASGSAASCSASASSA